MERLKAIIVDDELPARNELDFLLDKVDQVDVIGQAEDGIKALELIKNKRPNLIFLDIQMPGKNGLEVASQIRSLEIDPFIVFITAYDEYAIEAFEVNAIDYLLKPFEEERLITTIKRIKKFHLNSNNIVMKERLESLFNHLKDDASDVRPKIDKLAVRTKRGRIKLIENNEVMVLYTKSSKIYAKTYNEEYQVDYNLCELEKKLKEANFLRIHRSYLINLNQIKEIIPWFKGKYQVVMKDKEEMKVPVSRSKVKIIQKIFDL